MASPLSSPHTREGTIPYPILQDIPALFVLLSLQVTASVIAVMGIMIPLAFVLMAVGTAITWRYAHRRCK